MDFICGPEWDRRVISLEPKGKIGLMITGGIDSWVLFNLLLQATHLDITLFTIDRKDGFDKVEHVEFLTGRSVIPIPETTTNHKDRYFEGITKIFKDFDIDELYTGINITPPTDFFPEFESVGKPQRPWRKPEYEEIKYPFQHLYKYHIIELAKSNDIDLSETLSCIAHAELPCGECWQCMERAWGFDQLT